MSIDSHFALSLDSQIPKQVVDPQKSTIRMDDDNDDTSIKEA